LEGEETLTRLKKFRAIILNITHLDVGAHHSVVHAIDLFLQLMGAF